RKSQRFHYDTGSLAVFHHAPNGKYSDVLQRFVIQCPTVYLCHRPFIHCATTRCLGKCTLSYGLVSKPPLFSDNVPFEASEFCSGFVSGLARPSLGPPPGLAPGLIDPSIGDRFHQEALASLRLA